jgi:protein-S-isoprenylcysteine O-methyltransferase Ste14
MAAVMAAAALATAVAPGQAAAWLPAPLQAVAAATATLACLTGGMIVIWAAVTLGANFAVGAQVRGDTQAALVTGGPFALVRHPLYAALALLAAGAALAWGSLLGLAVVLVAYPPTARWRAALEDEALAAAWPDTWPAYAAKTPRFVPRI